MKLLVVLLNSLIIIFLACDQPISNKKTDYSNLTYAEHIQPIIKKNCIVCHWENGAGPFELITYQDVKKHAKMISKVTQSGYMPPWPADINYSHFLDERILNEEQKKLLKLWVEQGAMLGDTSVFLAEPYLSEQFEPKADITLRLDKPIPIKGNNTDQFLVAKFPFENKKEIYVRYIEFVPDQKKIVHHVNSNLINYDGFIKTNLFGGNPFANAEENSKKQVYETLGIPNDDGSYPSLRTGICSYLPGMQAYEYPNGIGGFIFPKKGMLMADEIHYGPSLIDTEDNSYFKLYLMNEKPKRPVNEITIGTNGIGKINPPLQILPNTISKHKISLTITETISLLNINPHMHLLGKKFVSYVIKPNGDTIKLIKINKWDFRWQYVYTFPKIIKIEKGSILIVEGEFDNTTNNPLNPNYPPKLVSDKEKSMRTTDEMFQLILCYLPYQNGDEKLDLKPYGK